MADAMRFVLPGEPAISTAACEHQPDSFHNWHLDQNILVIGIYGTDFLAGMDKCSSSAMGQCWIAAMENMTYHFSSFQCQLSLKAIKQEGVLVTNVVMFSHMNSWKSSNCLLCFVIIYISLYNFHNHPKECVTKLKIF